MSDLFAVVGASGNLGSAAADALLARGATVRVLGGDLPGLKVRFPAADVARLDLLDETTFAGALDGVTGLFVLRPPAAGGIDAALQSFLDAAERLGVRHVVFSSVAGADEKTWLPHAKIEQHLSTRSLERTLLRPGFFLQNLETAYRVDIKRDDRLYVPAADAEVAWIDTRDIGEAAAVCLLDPDAHAGQAYHLTGEETRTFGEIADLLTEVLGRPIRYQPASVGGYAFHLLVRHQMSVVQTLVQTYLHTDLRRGTASVVTPDLPRLLGRSPRTARRYIQDHAHVWAKP
jgi:uncharacterized protein YbjT (DUF2867 family)